MTMRLNGRVQKLWAIDTRGLALLRMGLAALLLVDLMGRGLSLRAHYTDHGVLPRAAAYGSGAMAWISPYAFSGGVVLNAILFMVAACFALMLLVGYRTRLATALSWLMLVFLHGRNVVVLNSGDTLLGLLLFWSIFLPLGACASVDARGGAVAGRPQRVVCSVASLALVAQIILMYLFTALFKDHPIWHTDHTAVDYALNLDPFTTPLGRWLLQFPMLTRVLTYATYRLELYGPVLLLVPFGTRYWRLLAVVGFVGLHLGLALTMRLTLFPYVCILIWLSLLPTEAWDRSLRVGPLAWGRLAWDRILDRVTKWIVSAARRVAWLAPSPPWWRLSKDEAAMVIAALIFTISWNVSVYRPSWPLSNQIRRYGTDTPLFQDWAMFAPHPMREDGWFVAPARLRNGQEVNLLAGGDEVTWDRSPQSLEPMRPYRWRKYLNNLWITQVHRPNIRYYADWLRRQWNQRHPASEQIRSMAIGFVCEYTQPDDQPHVMSKHLLYEWDGPNSERVTNYLETRRQLEAARSLNQTAKGRRTAFIIDLATRGRVND